MASAGWYSDPGGSGQYRYWDGAHWTAALSDTPSAPPPSGATPPPAGSSQQQDVTPDTPAGDTTRRTWWVVGGVILLAAVIAGGFGIRQVLMPGGPANPPGGGGGGGQTQQVCPPMSGDPATVPPQADPSRVSAGNLSAPALGSPWSGPQQEVRVPFARGALSQSVTIHPNYDGMSSWVASVVLAELYTGDGFYAPEQGAEVVVKCVVGTFYGDNTDVTREDIRSEKITVDGHDAWIIESDLSFEIPNLPTKNELLIVVVVDTQDGNGGLFYASVPGDAMELEPDVRRSLEGLRVEK